MDSRITEVQVMKNKRLRGQVLRTLVLFYPSPVDVGTLKSALITRGISASAETASVLSYLADENRKYIRVKTKGENMNEIQDSDLVELTADGIDLIEGTQSDAGVDM